MQSLLGKALKAKLKGAKRIAVLGVGSDLRADDRVGILAAEYLKKYLLNKKPRLPTEIFLGFTAPENLTGEIRRFKPSHIIIIDTVEVGRRPGEAFIVDLSDEGPNVSFATHQLPAKILVDYFRSSLRSKAIILGFQPKVIKFGFPVSDIVRSSAKRISSEIGVVIGGL